MDPILPSNDSPNPLDELSPALRAAVEQARSQPVPADALQRALERAAALPARTPLPWRRRLDRVVLPVALAASVMMVAGLGFILYPRGTDPAARGPAAQLQPQAAPADARPNAETSNGTAPASTVAPVATITTDNYQPEKSAHNVEVRTKTDTSVGDSTTTALKGPDVNRPVGSPGQPTEPGPDPTSRFTRTSPMEASPAPVPATPPVPVAGPLPSGDAPARPGRLPPASGPVTSSSGTGSGSGYAPTSPYGMGGLGTHTPATGPYTVPFGTTPRTPLPGMGMLGGFGGPNAIPFSPNYAPPGSVPATAPVSSFKSPPVYADPTNVTVARTRQKEVTDLARNWGALPEKERARSLEEIVKNLPPQQRAAVHAYFLQLAAQQGQQQFMAPVPPVAPNEAPGSATYSHYVDNPYQAAQQNPLSTFSISVDTASYSNVRHFLLQAKQLPPPDAVRVADLINYFPYAYPQPTGEHPVSFTLNLAECPWNAKHQLLRIGMTGKKIDPALMPPRNFVFLLDTSGSMERPNRLPLLKKSLELLTEQLTAQDRVAIVAYAGSAGLVLPSTPGSEKQKILDALGRLHAGGSTNGGAGIELAYKVATESFLKNGLNRVILGTDGDFNVGVTNEADLIRLIEEKRKSGVYLTILGFGMDNLQDSRMSKMAYAGGGHYAFMDNLDEARKLFVDQGGALVTIAKDVKLQLEFNPQLVAGYRLIGYENRLLRAQDFNDDSKLAGNLGAGHTVTALYEIVPAGQPVPIVGVDPLKYQTPAPPSPAAASGEWLTVKMRYKDPDSDSSKLLTQPLTGASGKFDKAPDDFRFAAAVASFGMLLRQSEYRGSMTWSAVREIAKGALGKDPGGHRAEFLKLVEAAEKLTPAAPPRK